jgi:hypothetical protein
VHHPDQPPSCHGGRVKKGRPDRTQATAQRGASLPPPQQAAPASFSLLLLLAPPSASCAPLRPLLVPHSPHPCSPPALPPFAVVSAPGPLLPRPTVTPRPVLAHRRTRHEATWGCSNKIPTSCSGVRRGHD